MSARVVVKFRDGTVREFPDPRVGVTNMRGYRVVYENGVLRVMDPYDVWLNWPLDIIESVIEEPQPRW